MEEQISRRSAIQRMFALFSTADLLVWEAPRHEKIIWSVPPTKIIPGERFGHIVLDMTKTNVVSILGLPCETTNFEAEDREETLRLYEYLNNTTGSNLTVEAYPPRPAMTFFNYDRLGLSIGLVNNRVCQIHAYSGVLAGYIEEPARHAPRNAIPPGAFFINTLNEVLSKFGDPDQTTFNKFAPIPDVKFSYNGIAFDGRADDGRLATITIVKRKI